MTLILKTHPSCTSLWWVQFALLFCTLATFQVIAAVPQKPFPQHLSYTDNTIRPNNVSQAQQDAHVRTFYDHWKQQYLVSAGHNIAEIPLYRVAFGQGSGITVSEGQGYGMQIVTVMAGHDDLAQTYFDGLWYFSRAYPSAIDARLMSWKIKNRRVVEGNDSAFDGDVDIAYALLMADAQWGSQGEINYRAEAGRVIQGILDATIGKASFLPKLGDWVNDDGATYNQYSPRSSDFMPAHFRAFQQVNQPTEWQTVITQVQASITGLQDQPSNVTGLLPDFLIDCEIPSQCDRANAYFLEGEHDGDYYYNAGRVPWRLGLDVLLNGDATSRLQVQKMLDWVASDAAHQASGIKAGYQLNGRGIGEYLSTFFVAPLGVAAMIDPSKQAFLNDIYAHVYATEEGYYEDSVNLLSLLVMTGNFWSPMGQASNTLGDRDQDGIVDGQDNCPDIANPIQIDTDNDGVGDRCQVVTESLWDIDANQRLEPLTDGLLFVRYLFGFRGDALVNHVISNGAQRPTANAIEAYIHAHLQEMDIDGDQQVLALSDGLLLMRYLSGIRGEPLVDRVIAEGASRQSGSRIERYVQTASVTQSVTPDNSTESNPQTESASCHIRYEVSEQWDVGFTARVSITNNLSEALDGWSVHWQLPEQQTITQLWNGNYTQQASDVTITDADWNRVVASGETFSFGFNGTHLGQTAAPIEVTVNGLPCSGDTPTPVVDNTDLVCQVNYVISDKWDVGFTATVEVVNLSQQALNGWTVDWVLGEQQQITHLWNGRYTQSNGHVQITHAAWNRLIAANESVSFGFNASHLGNTPTPTDIRVNGQACDLNHSIQSAPNSPTSLQIQLIDNEYAQLSWQDNSDNETGFVLERYTNATGWHIISRPQENQTQINDTTLAHNRVYRYRIQAVNQVASSHDSNEVEVKRQDRSQINGSMLADTCAMCHGTDGQSQGLAMPSIAGLEPEYFIKTMLDYQQNTRASTMMGRIARGYTQQQIESLADYFSQQKVSVTAQQGDPNQINSGETIHQTHCAVCHGDYGERTPLAPVRLSGQWQRYLQQTLEDYAANLSSNIPQGMATQLNAVQANEGAEGLAALASYYAANTAGNQTNQPPTEVSTCLATYRITEQWNTGFTANVSITNHTGATLNGWTLDWSMPNGQIINSDWNGEYSQIENRISVTPLDWNHQIEVDGRIDIGFNASYTNVNDMPLDIRLNHQLCEGQVAVDSSGNGNTGQTGITDPRVIPLPPSGLELFAIDNAAIRLQWQDNSQNETGFRIQSRELTGVWATLMDVTENQTDTTDIRVEMGKTYEYRVFALNDTGSSDSTQNSLSLLSLLAYGDFQYRRQGCAGCHGEQGQGGFTQRPLTGFTVNDFSALAKINRETMPPSNPRACTGNCATAIAEYIITTFEETTEPPVISSCDVNSPPASPQRLRLLTRYEYQQTVNDLLGLSVDLIHELPDENRVNGFDNHVLDNQVTGIRLEAYLSHAESLASQAIQQHWGELVPCDRSEATCARQFIQTMGKRAFRRPLSEAEIATYEGYFTHNDFVEAVETTLMTWLSSPHFLYRSEIGVLQDNGYYQLTPYEIASSLSYLFWGTLPDDALFQAADDRSLLTERERITQASRLLNDPRSRAQVGHFVGQWLLASSPYSLPDKDTGVYPDYDDNIRQALSQELIDFFNHVLFDSSQQYSELFTAPYVMGDLALANYYDLPLPDKAGVNKIPVTDQSRTGLLTLGAVLARYANSNESHPFKRGAFVMERLLCHDLPEAVNMGVVVPPVIDPAATTRERFSFHSESNASCYECHQYLDGAGFSFEHYDGAGQFRATENGKPIDSAGILRGLETYQPEEEIAFNDLPHLSQIIADSPNAAECLAKQYYRYTTGREDNIQDNCVQHDFIQSYRDNHYNLRTLFLGIVGTHGFIQRRAE